MNHRLGIQESSLLSDRSVQMVLRLVMQHIDDLVRSHYRINVIQANLGSIIYDYVHQYIPIEDGHFREIAQIVLRHECEEYLQKSSFEFHPFLYRYDDIYDDDGYEDRHQAETLKNLNDDQIDEKLKKGDWPKIGEILL